MTLYSTDLGVTGAHTKTLSSHVLTLLADTVFARISLLAVSPKDFPLVAIKKTLHDSYVRGEFFF